jgi:hypothetical protein
MYYYFDFYTKCFIILLADRENAEKSSIITVMKKREGTTL